MMGILSAMLLFSNSSQSRNVVSMYSIREDQQGRRIKRKLLREKAVVMFWTSFSSAPSFSTAATGAFG